MRNLFVGIDISKAELEVCVHPGSKGWKTPNDPVGLAELVGRLSELSPKLIVMEATGGLERSIQVVLEGAGLPVRVVNPRQVRDFAKGMQILAKTDAIDAAVLAKYGEKAELEARPVKDEQTRELEAMVERRRQLVEMLTAEKKIVSKELLAASVPVSEPILIGLSDVSAMWKLRCRISSEGSRNINKKMELSGALRVQVRFSHGRSWQIFLNWA